MAGNQVFTWQETGIPSSPDVTILQAMQSPVVMVHKIIPRPGNKREMQLVINAKKKLNASQILALQDDVLDLTKHPLGGPGPYRFEVTDSVSSSKQVWETRLGGDASDETPPALPAAAPSLAVVRAPMPLSPETENIGGGVTYNSRYKLLSFPDGAVLPWDPATQPFPTRKMVESTTAVQGTSTPLAATLAMPQVQPEVIELRAKADALQAALDKTREEARERQRAQELENMRTAHTRELAELREAQEKQMAEMRALVQSMTTAKPAVDSEVAELKRMLAEREQKDALRAEFTSQISKLEALIASQGQKGPDPMINVLMQMMAQQASASQENMRILREASSAQLGSTNSAAENVIEILKAQLNASQNGGVSMLNEKMIQIMGNLLEMATRVNGSGGSSGTNWGDILATLADKIGNGVTAVANMRSREAAAEVAKANAQTVANARHLRSVPAAAVPVEAIATPTPTSAPTPAPAQPVATAAADAPTSPTPPPAAPNEDPVRTISLPEMRKAFGSVPDKEFFGPFFESVADLRQKFASDASAFTADEVASFVMDARGYIVQAAQETGALPLAAELLGKSRFEYVFERMLPTLGEGFWHEATVALKAKLVSEKANAAPPPATTTATPKKKK